MYLILSNIEGASFSYSHPEYIADDHAQSMIIKGASHSTNYGVDLPDSLR